MAVAEILLHVIGDVHHPSTAVGAHDHRDAGQEPDREVPRIIHGIDIVATRDQAQAVLDSNFLFFFVYTKQELNLTNHSSSWSVILIY